MSETVMSKNALQEAILQWFHSECIRVREENGVVTLSPIEDQPYNSPLFGFFKDGKFTTEAYFEQKHLDKELEA